jgi:TIR domain
VRFSTARFGSLSQREAYEIIRSALRQQGTAWAQPGTPKWRLEMGGLFATIGRPEVVPWLNGEITVEPEFRSDVLSTGPPKIIDAQFAFYITPETIATGSMPSRNQVFISYSHANKNWVDRVRVHLRSLERHGLIELFDDSEIKPGSRWREEIQSALERAKVAILLVSADFIASDFIAENELPPLLKKAESGGATILPVIVSPCGFKREKNLSSFQSVNDPSEPLEGLTHSESEQVLTDLADAVEQALAGKLTKGANPAPISSTGGSSARVHPKGALAKELLEHIQKETNPDNQGLVEILDSPEPGNIFFLIGLRDSGSPYKVKGRLFREAVEELVATGWLYPPEHTGKTQLYEFKASA